MAARSLDIVYKSSSVKVKTPDGTLFIDILEDEHGKPFKVLARIGKSGSTTAAWVDACAMLTSHVLETHGVDYCIALLYMIRSDKVTSTSTFGNRIVQVHSGPEGFAHALSVYKKDRYEQLKVKLGIDDDDNDNYRSASKRR